MAPGLRWSLEERVDLHQKPVVCRFQNGHVGQNFPTQRCGGRIAEVRSTSSAHVYEVRPRKDHRGVDLISDALPFGRLWYLEVSDAIDYAKFRSRSHDAVIRVYDQAGNVIETHEHKGDFKEP
jgi:hypothetical protein